MQEQERIAQEEQPQAGRDTDRIAALVLGWRRLQTGAEELTGIPPGRTEEQEVPYFSTDAGDAAQVVEFLRLQGYSFTMSIIPAAAPGAAYGVALRREEDLYACIGETFALAVTRTVIACLSKEMAEDV